MAVFNLADQFINYYEYHKNPLNQLIHFVFVPVLTFGIIMLLVAVPVQWPLLSLLVPPNIDLVMNLAFPFLILLVIYYLILDRSIGSLLTIELTCFLFLACHLHRTLPSNTYFVVSILVQVIGWSIQFLGHYWEGRRPALVDNGLQVFIAPMFVMVEFVFKLGLKQDLKKEVEQKLRQKARSVKQ